jgi:hypothetical protein
VKFGAAGDDDDGLSAEQALDNRACPNMRDDEGRSVKLPADLGARKDRHVCEARKIEFGGTGLEKQIRPTARVRPFGHGRRHAVERKLRSNGDEDQTTLPV